MLFGLAQFERAFLHQPNVDSMAVTICFQPLGELQVVQKLSSHCSASIL